jgi:hypothetical protein
MKGSRFVFTLSIVEVVRWIIVYLFSNFVKLNFDPGHTISGDGWLWFGMTFTASMIFASSGILNWLNPARYSVMLLFWSVFKLVFLAFTLFLLFFGSIGFFQFIFIGAPFDLFLVLFLLLGRYHAPASQE